MKSLAIAPDNGPTKKQKWLAELGWLGGPEGAALVAVVLAIPYIISRLIVLTRERLAHAKADL